MSTSTYNPSERKNKFKIKFSLKLPPKLKRTDQTFDISLPKLQPSTKTYCHEDPIMKKLSVSHYSKPLVKASNNFDLEVSVPVLQKRKEVLFMEAAVFSNNLKHTSLSVNSPLLVYDPSHIQLYKTEPKIKSDASNIKLSNGERPVFASKTHKVYFNLRKPAFSKKSNCKLKISVPILSNKTESKLVKNTPTRSDKTPTVIQQTVPTLSNGSPSLWQHNAPAISLGNTELVRNIPTMKDLPRHLSTDLIKSEPKIDLRSEELLQTVPLICNTGGKVEQNVPVLVRGEKTLEHNKILLEKQIDVELIKHEPKLVNLKKEFHNKAPKLIDVPRDFFITTPQLIDEEVEEEVS